MHDLDHVFPAPKHTSWQVDAKKTHQVKQNNRESQNSPFGQNTAGSDPVLELNVLIQKLDLTWIFLHGCKP
jgi:hypothetical protein